MFVCRHCGYTCHNDGVNCCNNIKCKNYGCKANTDNGGLISSTRYGIIRSDCEGKNCQFRPEDCCAGMRNQELCARQKCATQQSPMRFRGDDSCMAKRGYMSAKNEYCTQNSAQTECFDMPKSNCGMLGFATVPFQDYGEIYMIDEGLVAGTIFPQLDMPYNKRIIRRG